MPSVADRDPGEEPPGRWYCMMQAGIVDGVLRVRAKKLSSVDDLGMREGMGVVV